MMNKTDFPFLMEPSLSKKFGLPGYVISTLERNGCNTITPTSIMEWLKGKTVFDLLNYPGLGKTAVKHLQIWTQKRLEEDESLC